MGSLIEVHVHVYGLRLPQAHVYGTHGFKKGKVAWEFVTTRDSHGDECVCLGAGTKPVTSSSYDSSTHFWTIRAYNGTVYVPGGTRMTVSKIHQVRSGALRGRGGT